LTFSFLYGLTQIDTNDAQANTSSYRPAEERKGAWQEPEGVWLELEEAWQELEEAWQELEGVWQEPLKEEEGPGGMTLTSYCSILWDSGMEVHTNKLKNLIIINFLQSNLEI
jgi:hypothetical protein